MKLTVIRDVIDEYSNAITQNKDTVDVLFEYPHRWQKATSGSFKEVIEYTFQSKYTRRLWKKSRYRPVEMLQILSAYDAQWVEDAIAALFRDGKSINDRIDFFQFMGEELIKAYRKDHPGDILTSSYWDVSWSALLLSAHEPGNWAYYHSEIFFRAAEAMEMHPIPIVDDYDRYSKMIQIIFQFIERAELTEKRNIQLPKSLQLNELNYKNMAIEALAIYLKVDLLSEQHTSQ
jgi:hypothetical protein